MGMACWLRGSRQPLNTAACRRPAASGAGLRCAISLRGRGAGCLGSRAALQRSRWRSIAGPPSAAAARRAARRRRPGRVFYLFLILAAVVRGEPDVVRGGARAITHGARRRASDGRGRGRAPFVPVGDAQSSPPNDCARLSSSGTGGSGRARIGNPHPKDGDWCCFPHESSEWCMNSSNHWVSTPTREEEGKGGQG